MSGVGTSDAPNAPVQQPKPQVIANKSGGSSILVSSRQKGNPILAHVRGVPWEYADTPADYVLGLTTCALFLSLKYHRLHPEYIYTRIRSISGMFNLRILLTMVDIDAHEEALKELSKTSLINNVTLILCWSSQEAARYLELFKSYEGASASSIRGHQSNNYSDRLNDFVTVPRGINKTDAVGLVSTFGSVRTAVNARPDEVSQIAGWGEKKVQRWCTAVRENFRAKRATKRGVPDEHGRPDIPADTIASTTLPDVMAQNGQPAMRRSAPASHQRIGGQREFADENGRGLPDDDEDITTVETPELPRAVPPKVTAKSSSNDGLSEGVSAALKRLRRED